MTKWDETKLDWLLEQRAFTGPSSDLAERILAHTAHLPQRQPLRLWLTRLFAEFMLPRPAITFATLAVLGIALGLGLPLIDTTDTAAIYYEEGDWL